MTREPSRIRHQASPPRYEIKMVFSGLETKQIHNLILGHSQLFKVAFPPRQVNNIYYDSGDFQLLNAHIQGANHRSKLRLRWYHDTWKFSTSQYEIKSKSGNLGTKAVFPITKEIDLTNISWKQLLKTLKPHLAQNILHLLELTSPVLINKYQREYFESADRFIRITLDTNLKSFGQTFGIRPNLKNLSTMRNLTILEIKADATHYLKIASALEEFPQYCSAYSKYIHCTETIPL